MTDIELFYKIIESEIRRQQAEYLYSQKRIPLPLSLPKVDPLPSGEDWQKLGWFRRWKLKCIYKRQVRDRHRAETHPALTMDDKLTKGYNAGIELALKVLSREFDRYSIRLRKEAEEMNNFSP